MTDCVNKHPICSWLTQFVISRDWTWLLLALSPSYIYDNVYPPYVLLTGLSSSTIHKSMNFNPSESQCCFKHEAKSETRISTCQYHHNVTSEVRTVCINYSSPPPSTIRSLPDTGCFHYLVVITLAPFIAPFKFLMLDAGDYSDCSNKN